MKNDNEYKKVAIVESIAQRTKLLTSIVILVIITLLFVNLRVLLAILSYIPSYSLSIMLLIVTGLVIIGFYLSRKISIKAISNLDKYSNEINSLLLSKDQEIAKRKKVEEQLRESLHIGNLI